ncbi:NADAR family protein [Sphingomonas sp.]|uniref:NADAR family protein n=1 Tax=Sphingomonas sp. TaxID=28214 RepID=UPI001B141B8C|nr:NADAR family protein [Sphingomonas sp.]MBO9713013.1 NADAR family protein [Sphingomonas sp.]
MNAERFTFFWSGPFSQWHRSPFQLDGVLYNTAEQYMMAGKARLFGDEEMLARILAAEEPRDQKALGRRVRGFDGERWNATARDIVLVGSRAKFTQHRDLLQLLLRTEGTTLVEASPLDAIWGIGMAEDDPDARDRTKWRGTNWLGEVLTRLRDTLLAEQAANGIPEIEARAARKAKA